MQDWQPQMHFMPMIIVWILIFAIHMRVIRWASLWFLFQKAGEPGWAAIIPVYNILIAIKIAGKPWWYILMLLIPIVNIVMAILILHGISKSFGKGGWYTVGLIFLRTIFLAILGFGKSQYTGDKSKFNA
jgi:hypothetical protein